MKSIIQIKNLTKKYKIEGREIRALNNINLEINGGSFTTIVGKSGCGKSTFLRIIAGLETATSGQIFGTNKIKSSLVFQEARLMPWLTVEENILFPLKNKKKNKIQPKVEEKLQLLGLKEFKDAYPDQISGGMAQRTALGRALIFESDLILMDEPLGSLDAFNRYKLQEELKNIFSENDKTVIFVTHDIDEAIFLGDQVLVMDSGAIIEQFNLKKELNLLKDKEKYLELKEEILSELKA
ncbi:sulfonate transport system ATP-binding protein [Halanaerobium congolense]|uniref:Sulfonate transport system ATP-binding protein n=1 Tax=Halanaerobium congolense TaxID=54121 RepID=A0A4R8GHR3_9FIRM|nr:ABC transporter ATP-binding protein [Halanaerobium congolense]TDX39398.1 sulfonate transport system ATP-binding protein [Halanaerobium congolense]